MKGVSIFKVEEIKSWDAETYVGYGQWKPARPEGLTNLFFRIKCAWMVFTGKGDVVLWEK